MNHIHNELNEKDKKTIIKKFAIFSISFILLIAIVIGSFFGISALISKYQVWSKGMHGQAQLNEANWNRQIAVKEAEAKMESAKLLAKAEIERAKGVAKANEIIGQSLKDNEAYLRYLWINNLQNEKNQVIYVPTETNLPILEANRLSIKQGE